jgi:hypothetical protein
MPEGEYKFVLDEDLASKQLDVVRNAEINKLLDQRKILLVSGKIKEDPDILAINQRLIELTDPKKFAAYSTAVEDQVEGVMTSALESDRTKGFFKLADFENMSEGQKFIKAEQNKIINLRRRLITFLLPQIADQKLKSIIIGEVDIYDKEYLDFQSKVDFFADKDDVEVVKSEFENDFDDWYLRLLDIYSKAHSDIDH